MDWKLRSCAPFTKPSLDAAAESEKARAKLRAATRKTKKFPYKMGNPNLNRTWQHNTTTLDGFEPNVACVSVFLLICSSTDMQSEQGRRAQLHLARISTREEPRQAARGSACSHRTW